MIPNRLNIDSPAENPFDIDLGGGKHPIVSRRVNFDLIFSQSSVTSPADLLSKQIHFHTSLFERDSAWPLEDTDSMYATLRSASTADLSQALSSVSNRDFREDWADLWEDNEIHPGPDLFVDF